MCRGVRTTFGQRVTGYQDEQLGHTLGVGFISQVIQGGTSGELEGIKGQQVECYVQVQDAKS